LNRSDQEAFAALCAPDFRLDMSDRVFNPEVYLGRDGIRRFVADVHEVWDTFTWEPTDLIEPGDFVLALVKSVGRARTTGLEIDRHSAMLWQIPHETLPALRFYRDPSAGPKGHRHRPRLNAPATPRRPSAHATVDVPGRTSRSASQCSAPAVVALQHLRVRSAHTPWRYMTWLQEQ
jgi:ketosteroid isomerase-like protein